MMLQWFLSSVMIGLLPVGVRLFVFSVYVQKAGLTIIDPIDFITFSIALNIQTLNDLSGVKINNTSS